MSRNLLAKLTTKGVNLNPIGGTPDITWQDVAFAIAGLSEEQHLFARAVYCEDNADTKRLINLTSKVTQQDSALVRAALFEVAFKNRCSKCKGIGKVTVNTCDTCIGTGIAPLSDRQRAANVGRSRTFYESRRHEYEKLIWRFVEIDSAIVGHIKRRMHQAA